MATKEPFSKAKLGTGARFEACVRRVLAFYRKKGRKMTRERAEAICAKIGRKAYGKKRFTKLAVKGRTKKG